MNKAISISGQQRFVKEGLRSLQKNLVDFKNYDVFIHTWKDESSNENDLLLYKPKKILIEDSIVFDKECHDTDTHKSMFYSISKSLDLLLNYNKQYDAIIRTRFDISLEDRLDISQYPLERGIFSPDMIRPDRSGMVISDWFNFGNSKNMIVYRDMFYNYELLRSLGVNVHSGEEIITKTLNKLKVNMIKIKKKLFLIRPKNKNFKVMSYGWKYVDDLLY